MLKILQNASDRDIKGKISFSKVPRTADVVFILPSNQPIDLQSMLEILQNASDRELIGKISFSKVPRMAAVAFILPSNQPKRL